MTDLKHHNIIRMIASFTGLDFGKFEPTRQHSLSPDKQRRSQLRGLITKSHHKRQGSNQWNDNSSSDDNNGGEVEMPSPTSPTTTTGKNSRFILGDERSNGLSMDAEFDENSPTKPGRGSRFADGAFN